MTIGLFLTHRALPGRRDDLIAAWKKHMPSAVEANSGHDAYVYTAAKDDPDVLMVYQQYVSEAEAASFLDSRAYLDYLAESEPLLANQPAVVRTTPLWSKRVGSDTPPSYPHK